MWHVPPEWSRKSETGLWSLTENKGGGHTVSEAARVPDCLRIQRQCVRAAVLFFIPLTEDLTLVFWAVSVNKHFGWTGMENTVKVMEWVATVTNSLQVALIAFTPKYNNNLTWFIDKWFTYIQRLTYYFKSFKNTSEYLIFNENNRKRN